MTLKELIKKVQSAFNSQGEKLMIDGEYGPATTKVSEKYDVTITVKKKAVQSSSARQDNPSYVEAKKYAGKKETDSGFVAFLTKFWPKTGLNYKQLAGTSFAWCALFIVAMQSEVGQKYVASASAKRQGATGVGIEYLVKGIPKGAIIHINNGGDCKSSSNNHVTFADGDCSVADVNKSGATFPGFGGNQGNMVKRSMYKVKNICEVRWPSEVPVPPTITQSVNCSGAASDESTR